MVKAYARGDITEAKKIITDYEFRLKRKYGDDSAKIQSSAMSWAKKAIKNAYIEDRIDYSTAQKMLSSIAGMTDTKSICRARIS